MYTLWSPPPPVLHHQWFFRNKLGEMWVETVCNCLCRLSSLIDATHRDVDVLLLLSNSAYYVA